MISNKKSGFTLVELMFFFLFVTLILAASTPLITKRFKEIPQKINHGMFMCYYDGNALKQDYYNAVKRISTENVSYCTFKPPAKAALFKIELYGGGAGGYTYHEIPEDTFDPTQGNTFSMSSGLERKSSVSEYEKPSDEDLQRLFSGETFQKAVSSGKAGKGGDVEYYHHSLKDVKCLYKSEDDLTSGLAYDMFRACDDLNNFYRNPSTGGVYSCKFMRGANGLVTQLRNASLLSEISALINSTQPSPCNNYYYDYSTHHDAISNVCQTWNGDPTLADLEMAPKATVFGGKGGDSMTIAYSAKIDFDNVPLSKTTSYLQELWNSVKIGRKNGNTLSFVPDKPPENGENGASYMNEDIEKKGLLPDPKNDGADVKHHAAIKVVHNKLGNFSCYNGIKATGGTGAQVHIHEGGCIQHFEGQDGERADKLVKEGMILKGYCIDNPTVSGDIDPTLYIDMNLNSRRHIVGNGGNAGKYAVYHTQSLPDDCKFDISPGGAPINGEDGEISTPESLATSLICNDGAYKVSALGGDNSKTTTGPKVYFGYDALMNKTKEFITVGEGGGGTAYKPVKPFTVYEMPQLSPGSGGFGAKIIDKCTAPYGSYTYAMNSHSNVKEKYLIPQTCKPEGDLVKFLPAESGSPGAIIISW